MDRNSTGTSLSNEIKSSRCVDFHKQGKCELHRFSEAAEKNYAAVVYMRMIHGEEIREQFMVTKTNVVPLKEPSLFRGWSYLGLRYWQIKAIDVKDIDYYGRTDSSIVHG
ncbi:unnamed protein product [Hermetia illucens]|uniref:Uncharacterized protein n=1 Tax=Hermetia illucens TaxID=343691 RepID=A0A7R8URK3_HERIL|nr:unnamed protein product [Hermetia illucens]